MISASRSADAVRRGIATTYLTTLGTAALSLVNVLIISRSLGPSGRGGVVFLTTVASLGSYVFALSVQEANANIAGQEPHLRPALATNSVLLSIALGAAAGAVAVVGGILSPSLRAHVNLSLWVLAAASIPILILQNYLIYLARADYAFGVTNLATLLPAIGNPVLNGCLVLTGLMRVSTSTAVWVATQTAAVLMLAWHVGRRQDGFGRGDFALARRSVGFGLRTHIGGVMSAGNYRLDQYILGAVGGPRELGFYSVAVSWAEVLFFLPNVVTLVSRPELVRATPAAARLRAGFAARLATAVTVPAAVVMWILAPVLCERIFGPAFTNSVPSLRFLLLGSIGIVLLKILGNALVAQGRPLLESIGIGVALVLTVALDLLLIPSHGGVGAAIASTIAYTSAGIVTAATFVAALGGRFRDLLPQREDLTVMRVQFRLLRQSVRRTRG